MLQVNNNPKTFKIASIRKMEPPAVLNGSACSLEPGDGTDKPPC